MIDFIVAVILVVIVGSAICYIIKAKKKGVKCIGCPEGCNCGKVSEDLGCSCDGGSHCNCHTNEN